MRTRFTMVSDRLADLEVKLKADKIGDGELGAKSRALRDHKPLIEQTCRNGPGLIYVTNLPITPSVFSDFLKRAGASHEKPEKSAQAISKTEFLPSELDAIRAALAPFKGIYVAVRSDECTAGGNGLWHSGFMLADDSPEAVSKASGIVRRILQSEFSPAVVAFKKRVGLPMDATPGVFVMPLIAADFSAEADCPIFTTPHHANVITFFRGDEAVVHAGSGIGGANGKGVTTLLSRQLGDKRILPTPSLDMNLMVNGDLQGYTDLMSTPEASFIGFLMNRLYGLTSESLGRLREPLDKFMRLTKKKPKYLEIALGPEPHVIQCADVRLDDVKRPDVPEEQIIGRSRSAKDTVEEAWSRLVGRHIFAANVAGRGLIGARGVVYITTGSDLVEFNRINEKLSGYLMIVNGNFSSLRSIDFSVYSNAAAIFFTAEQSLSSAATHFNGALREAGIPVIAGSIRGDFLRGLKPGKVYDRKLLVYANDAEEEAFVATMD